MKISDKRQKLQEYILIAKSEKVNALYTLVEQEMETHYNAWEDPTFLAELEQRSNDLKLGKDKGVEVEKVKRKLQAKLKSKVV